MQLAAPDFHNVPLTDDEEALAFFVHADAAAWARWHTACVFRPLLEPGHAIVIHSRCDCAGVPLDHTPPLPDWDAYLESGDIRDL